MAEEPIEVVQVHGDDTYEKIWDVVRSGALVTVEFTRVGDRRMRATTVIIDDHGVTTDKAIVEL